MPQLPTSSHDSLYIYMYGFIITDIGNFVCVFESIQSSDFVPRIRLKKLLSVSSLYNKIYSFCFSLILCFLLIRMPKKIKVLMFNQDINYFEFRYQIYSISFNNLKFIDTDCKVLTDCRKKI